MAGEVFRAATIPLVHDIYELVAEGIWLIRQHHSRQADTVIGGALAVAANTLLGTLNLVVSGYPDAAYASARLLLECWMGAIYAVSHPDEAEEWLARQKMPQYGQLAKDIADAQESAKFLKTRKFLDKFAHLSYETLRRGIVPSEGGPPNFSLGPKFGLRGFDFVMYPTLTLGSGLLRACRQRVGIVDRSWSARADALMARIGEWLRGFNAQYLQKASG